MWHVSLLSLIELLAHAMCCDRHAVASLASSACRKQQGGTLFNVVRCFEGGGGAGALRCVVGGGELQHHCYYAFNIEMEFNN